MVENNLDSELAFLERELSGGNFEKVLRPLLEVVSKNPNTPAPRILLARTFYEMGLLPLSIRELQDLRAMMPESKYPVRLLERLSPDVIGAVPREISDPESSNARSLTPKDGEETLSEVELDTDKVKG